MAVRLLGTGEGTLGARASAAPAPQPAPTRWRRRYVPKAASAVCDSVAIAAAMLLAYVAGGVSSIKPLQHDANYFQLALLSIPIWIVVFARYGLYSSRRITSRTQEYRQVFHGVVVAVALMTMFAYVFQTNVARRWLLLTF